MGETMPKKVKKTKTNVIPKVETMPMPASDKTEAEKIWDEIKSLGINMYGLPGQTVSQHCTPVMIDPSRLFVTMRSTATLPSLEAAIGKGFTVELADKFVIVARATPSYAKK
jgi:hypothetical protein